jgi:DNA repair exonuclease SbcCD nuclease subunit
LKYAIVADVHVDNFRKFGGPIVAGVNRRGKEVLTSLRCAYQFAKNAKCDRFIVLGDLFHSSKPSPQLISQVASILVPQVQTVPVMRTDLMVGNHDQVSMAVMDNAMSPFTFMGVRVIDEPGTCDDGDLAYVPFQPGRAVDWLPAEVAQCQGASLLGLHLGVFDDKTQPFLQKCEDAVSIEFLTELCDKYDIGDVVAGNWHHGRKWETDTRTVVIPGALSPTGFADLGRQRIGRLVIWDDGDIEVHSIPGIRFIKCTLQEFKDRNVGRSKTHYFKLMLQPDEFEEAKTLILAQNVGDRCELAVDRSDTEGALADAAEKARNVESLDEAIDGYIEALELPEHATRAGVKKRVRAYRKKAQQ